VPYDCQASKAHARILGKIGMLTESEVADLIRGLDQILELYNQANSKSGAKMKIVTPPSKIS
jgi:argininosuccinate lyase